MANTNFDSPREELAATITHLAFYAGFPAAISASAAAQSTLGDVQAKQDTQP